MLEGFVVLVILVVPAQGVILADRQGCRLQCDLQSCEALILPRLRIHLLDLVTWGLSKHWAIIYISRETRRLCDPRLRQAIQSTPPSPLMPPKTNCHTALRIPPFVLRLSGTERQIEPESRSGDRESNKMGRFGSPR